MKSFTLHIMSSRSSSADVLEKIRKSKEDAESTSCHPQALVADRTDRQWKCQLGRQVVEASLLCKQTRSTFKYPYKSTFSIEKLFDFLYSKINDIDTLQCFKHQLK